MNTDFAAILKTYRQKEQISQTELANKLGISRNYVSLIERGVRDNVSWRLGCKILRLCVPRAERKCPECCSLNAMISDDFSQGVCNHCGYAWTGGYPIRKSLLLDLLPGRNVNTISYRARFLRLKKQKVPAWSKSDDKTLQSIYATSKMQDLLDAFPGKSKGAIYQRAFHLGLKRDRSVEQKKCPGCGKEIQHSSKQCRQCYESRNANLSQELDNSHNHKRKVLPKKIRYLPWEKSVLAELGGRVSMTELRMLLPRRSRKQIKEMAAAFHIKLLDE